MNGIIPQTVFPMLLGGAASFYLPTNGVQALAVVAILALIIMKVKMTERLQVFFLMLLAAFLVGMLVVRVSMHLT